MKTCIAAQREMNRLLGLYGQDKAADDHPKEDPALAAVRSHLAPLFHDGENVEAAELARRAVAEIVSLRMIAKGGL